MTSNDSATDMAAGDQPPIIRAERHFNNGEFVAASEICEELCRQNVNRGPALYLLGLISARGGRLEEAHAKMSEALRLHPAAPHLRHDLVSLCARMGRDDEAEAHLQDLIDRNPEDAGSYEHLALVQKGRGRTDEAIASFRKALEIAPDAVGAHQALGGLLYQQGDLEAALEHLLAARAAKPAGEDPYQNLGMTLLGLGRYEELLALDPKQARTAGQRFNETVLKALLAWQEGDIAGCERHVADARPFARIPDRAPNRRVFTALFNYLQKLLEIRKLNRRLYRAADAPEIFALGDSHCLMAAHTGIPVAGVDHRVVPRMVLGCKAYHLVSPRLSPQRIAFERTLARLPERAKVIVILGAGDLLHDDGIIGFLRRSPEADPSETAGELARSYFARLRQLVEASRLSLIVMSPPPSNMSRSTLPEVERGRYEQVIRTFQQELRESVAGAGRPYIDLFAATRDEEGKTRPKFYVDAQHVRPSLFVEAATAAGL